MKVKLHWKKSAGLRLLALPLAGWLGVAPVLAQSDNLLRDVRRDATVQAVQVVLPSVVNIATATVKYYVDFYDPIFRQYYGHQREGLYNIGSGIIVDEDGYVLTNLHVMQRATRAQVKLWDGRIFDVQSAIPLPGSDLALLKLRVKPGEKLKAIKFAPDDDLLLGETVIALGNPFGLGGSVSRGILSSKNVKCPVDDLAPDVKQWLQTDAAINPGNSGGPLVNLRGELIGVNTAVYQGQGIGFAIPVKQVSLALAQALAPESTDALWFGAQVRPNSDALTINSIQPGSPADEAGLKAGEDILQVDGETPTSIVDFNRLVVASKDHKVSLRVQNGSGPATADVKLVPFDDLIRKRLGLVLQDASRDTVSRFGDGMVIQEVEPGSPAARAKLQRGFLLKTIDGQATGDLNAVALAISGKPAGTECQLTVVVLHRISGFFVQSQEGTVTVRLR